MALLRFFGLKFCECGQPKSASAKALEDDEERCVFGGHPCGSVRAARYAQTPAKGFGKGGRKEESPCSVLSSPFDSNDYGPPTEPWSGWYVDKHKGEKHPMELDVSVCAKGVVEGSGADAAGKFTISGTLCGITADAARHGAKPAVPADASHVLRIEKHYFEDRFGRERAWSVSAICHSDDEGRSFRGQPCHGEKPIRGGELVFDRSPVSAFE